MKLANGTTSVVFDVLFWIRSIVNEVNVGTMGGASGGASIPASTAPSIEPSPGTAPAPSIALECARIGWPLTPSLESWRRHRAASVRCAKRAACQSRASRSQRALAEPVTDADACTLTLMLALA